MVGLVHKHLWGVFAALIVLTLTSALISERGGLVRPAVVAIFAIAAIKAVLVLDNFMEAPHAERHWLWLYRLWIAAVTILLTVAFAS
jgi:heme/copper-type cytochrome/quinol oxidase subunit 4